MSAVNAAAVQAFWQWWGTEGRALAEAALTTESAEEATAEGVETHVAAIAEGLEWELAPDGDNGFLLVVTAAGDPELRAPARAWWHAAPADEGWTYLDLRPATPDANEVVIEHAGHDIDLGRAVVGARAQHATVDVAVHHPVFADLGDQDRAMLAYLLLDMFLGEEMSEMWLGEVSWPSVPPLDAFPMQHLAGVVREMAQRHELPGGGLSWAALEGTTPDGRVVTALAQVPLRQITAPDLDTHCAILVPIADVADDGSPMPSSIEALDRLEDEVSLALGDQGRLVAHQTQPGERLFHFYLDSANTADRLRPLLEAWPHGDVEVTVTVDPGWGLVSHLSGAN